MTIKDDIKSAINNSEQSVIKDQPDPIVNNNSSIHDLVIDDIKERKKLGLERYGTILQAHNGRDALVDMYQEQLDKICYTRQMIEERICGAQACFNDIPEKPFIACAHKYGHEGEHSWKFLEKLVDFNLWYINQVVGLFHSNGFDLPETKYKNHLQALKDIAYTLSKLANIRQENKILHRERDGEVWVWQDDEYDHLESLTCPILIQPEELIKLSHKGAGACCHAPEKMHCVDLDCIQTECLNLHHVYHEGFELPIPMVIFCPNCHTQHIDKAEEQCPEFYGTHQCELAKGHSSVYHSAAPLENQKRWTNPPHKSHLCHGCGNIFRFANYPTNGVENVEPGENDNYVQSFQSLLDILLSDIEEAFSLASNGDKLLTSSKMNEFLDRIKMYKKNKSYGQEVQNS